MSAVSSQGDLPMTFGVEEEFFLVDPQSRDLLSDPDPRIFDECSRNSGPHKVVHEFLRSQIETNTRVCHSVADVRASVLEIRKVVMDAASTYGAVAMGASTHPFASWRNQVVTAKQRYEDFVMTMQDSVRRLLVGGMHIHLGFADADSRIHVMTAMRRYLPVLHALSASSPFSGGRHTGFKSYRLSVFAGLPRTGIPDPLQSQQAFDDLVESYRRMEFIKGGGEIWWDIRPSHSFPTIELRVCDICPRVEDAMCVVALYACLARNLLRHHRAGDLPEEPPTVIIEENLWLAQRYGTIAFLGDTVAGGRTDIGDLVGSLVEDLVEDAEALDCVSELRHALTIVREGSSADRQIDHYRLRRLEGATEAEAVRSVVDLICDETRAAADAAHA